MIRKDASLTITLLPLSDLSVWEYQDRYPDRIAHYIALMQANREDHPGLLVVKPRDGRYEVLDGHHRYIAHIATGRSHALCLVVDESGSGSAA